MRTVKVTEMDNYILRAALRERRAMADRIANWTLLGFGLGSAFGALVTLAVVELAR